MLDKLKFISINTILGTFLGAMFGFSIPLIYIVAFDIVGSIVMQDGRFRDASIIAFFSDSINFMIPTAVQFAAAGAICGGIISLLIYLFTLRSSNSMKPSKIGRNLGVIGGYIPEFLHLLVNEYYIFDGVTLLKISVFVCGGALMGWLIGKSIENRISNQMLEFI